MKNVKLTRLDNGLRVVTKSLDNFESVMLGYWVKAGAACETKENNGISHFLEHMAFKGTSSRTAKQIAEEIESVGGYLNAYTSRETTAFHAKLLKDDRHIAIDILSDILQNPTFANIELERERGVILQEISQTNDTPDDIIFDHFQDVAFPNQSMGRSILGPVDVVSAITANDLRKYRNRFYNADNIIFGAVGNISHDEILEYADKYFHNFGNVKTPELLSVYDYKGGCYSDVRDLEQAHIILGFNGISSVSEDFYALAIFSSILGGGMSSRLFQEVREKRGLVYSVYSFSSSYSRNGLFGVYAATSPDKLSELVDVASVELMKMSENISEDEFNRTKAQFKAGLLMSQESNSSMCEQIVNQTMIFGRPLTRDEILTKIDKVSIDDVKRLTKKITASNTSIITVGKCEAEHMIQYVKKNGLIANSNPTKRAI
ncbi:MAG: insulinase family protein [Alphaproteobacteria bacterium]|nr:insulinase family protein [Alphaproteobacteria bacterium]